MRAVLVLLIVPLGLGSFCEREMTEAEIFKAGMGAQHEAIKAQKERELAPGREAVKRMQAELERVERGEARAAATR